MANAQFPQVRFRGKLRPSQQDVVDIARKSLDAGERQLYVVAPPGSGKTVLGLYLWAECVQRPALVLSPNSAIQMQWAARTDMFDQSPPGGELASTDPTAPGLLTSLTYQSVTLPRRGDDGLDDAAFELWQSRLIEKDAARDPEEARIWIRDLKKHNRNYYDQRLSAYRKEVRDEASLRGETLDMLHRSSLATLDRLKAQEIGLIILDECHHLVGHWGRVLADAAAMFNNPVILGLTATPPDVDNKSPQDFERYTTFFGPIDYDVPVPAVVKDGFLAPYQDLAYFVRPSQDELRYVASADDLLHEIVALASGTEKEVAPPVKAAARKPAKPPKPVSSEEEEAPIKLLDLSDLQVIGSAEAAYTEEPNAEPTVATDPVAEPAEEVETVPGAPRVPPLPTWLYNSLAEKKHAAQKYNNWSAFERRDPEFAAAARLFLQMRELELPPDVPPAQWDPAAEAPEMAILVPVLDRYVRHALRRSANEEDHQLGRDIIARLRMLGVQITETGCQACASPVGRVLAYSREKAQAVIPILHAEMKALGDSIRAIVVADYEKTAAVMPETADLLDEEAGGAVAAFRTLLKDEQTDRLQPILVTGSSVLIDDDLQPQFDHVAHAWLQKEGFQVNLDYAEEEGFCVVRGEGADWSPRVYIEMITELFQQGVTRCLVGTRGLLGEGWDANKINVLIDLTTVTTSMSVRQLRGRSFRLDPAVPEKVANNWDVVCIAPEFSKGLDDYARFRKKHDNTFGVTDDGEIEKGVGHVHAALTDLRPELLEDSIPLLNGDMLKRAEMRATARKHWKIGEPYHGEPRSTLEVKLDRDERENGGFPPFKSKGEVWSDDSLVMSVGTAILSALAETKQISPSARPNVKSRAGGYVRMFLEDASEEDSQLFAASLREALGPLLRPRYVIPRKLRYSRPTFWSKLLPEFLGQYLEQKHDEMVMLHAVPTALAKKKEIAEVYEKYWNQFVSPGQALYALRGEGEDLRIKAEKKGLTPRGTYHEKEVFS
ncbi:DEAD/DEAH box helicase family protein [Blastopirellula sp. JC732]|uniref:DEAD/DEAH box helicase family protein n=1 Tax=Blastopirellula sediminis TaxID=2894196 RepID=A0A9X1SH64_9BACT|nr:DEAD/DEAH box helicase family protein [Blastopirellula sediminis]MCC9607236.1 DEAD/DEAH box helicase family protein [Blastopirellula sediminis]MCC9629471.1 DEAD/DEAH box helicase family protein [Blastopirellula sediminis]